jgi:PIN domain nuclease of toxin-antitoxin system
VIVLDTHALLWWANDDARLSRAAKRTIRSEQSGGVVAVSVISAWEIGLLVEKGKLALSMEVDAWLSAAMTLPGIRMIPLTLRVAVQSTRLPGAFHPDPADRMIVALAREHDAMLVSADQRIRAYPHVRTIW